MKRYIAFIVAILILFAVGCSNPQTSGGGTPDAQTPSAPPTAQASTPAPAVIRAQSHAGRGCGIFAP